MLEKLTPREKTILAWVIALLVLVTGYHGVWRPMTAKIGDLDDEIFSLQLKIRKAKTLLRQKDEVLEESKKYPNLGRMNAGSDEEEIARLLNFIEQTARKLGVSLSDVKPQAVQSDKMSKRYLVELNAESGLKELASFVYGLEHSPEILKIEQVNTGPKDEKSALLLRSAIVVTRVVVK